MKANLLTDDTLRRLHELIVRDGGTFAAQDLPTGRVRGRTPVLVRCTSATAAGVDGSGSGSGGSGSGDDAFDECYPGVVVDPRTAEESPQPELGAVWLTVLGHGGQAKKPVANGLYTCLLAGRLDIDGDERIRAFGVLAFDPCRPPRCQSSVPGSPISVPNPCPAGSGGSGSGGAVCEPLVLTLVCGTPDGVGHFPGRFQDDLYVTTEAEYAAWVAANPTKSWCCEGERLGKPPCGQSIHYDSLISGASDPINTFINFLASNSIQYTLIFCGCTFPGEATPEEECEDEIGPIAGVKCLRISNGTGSYSGFVGPVDVTATFDGAAWNFATATEGGTSIGGSLVYCTDPAGFRFAGTILSTTEHPSDPDFSCGCTTVIPRCAQAANGVSQEQIDATTIRVTTACGTIDIEIVECEGSGSGASCTEGQCNSAQLLGETAEVVIPDGPNAGTYFGIWAAEGDGGVTLVATDGSFTFQVQCSATQFVPCEWFAQTAAGGGAATSVDTGPPHVLVFPGSIAGGTADITVTT